MLKKILKQFRRSKLTSTKLQQKRKAQFLRLPKPDKEILVNKAVVGLGPFWDAYDMWI